MSGLEIIKWVVTPHAADRMVERNITSTMISSIIDAPDSKVKQGPKLILAKSFSVRNDNHIAVVLLERKELKILVVLTVMVNFKTK